MPDRAEEQIRALVVELAELAPAAPSFQEIEDRATILDRPRRRGALMVGAIAMVSLALIVGVILTRPEERTNRVRAVEPSTTTTTTAQRPLRLSATVLPAGFVQKPGASDGFTISFSTGTGAAADRIVVGSATTGATTSTTLPLEVAQSATYTRGSFGQSNFGALVFFVWEPTGGAEAKPTGEQRQVGNRLVTLSRPQVPSAGGLPAVAATSASWREAGYAVSVLGFGVTDPDLQAFIGGLTVQRGPGRDFIPTNEPPPRRPDGTFDASGDPAMKFAQETGWMPVACPNVGGVCGYIALSRSPFFGPVVYDVVDAHGNLVGHFGGVHGGGFVPLGR